LLSGNPLQRPIFNKRVRECKIGKAKSLRKKAREGKSSRKKHLEGTFLGRKVEGKEIVTISKTLNPTIGA
jgi:hypothetical protein